MEKSTYKYQSPFSKKYAADVQRNNILNKQM